MLLIGRGDSPPSCKPPSNDIDVFFLAAAAVAVAAAAVAAAAVAAAAVAAAAGCSIELLEDELRRESLVPFEYEDLQVLGLLDEGFVQQQLHALGAAGDVVSPSPADGSAVAAKKEGDICSEMQRYQIRYSGI